MKGISNSFLRTICALIIGLVLGNITNTKPIISAHIVRKNELLIPFMSL